MQKNFFVEQLEEKINLTLESKWADAFKKEALYVGDGIYVASGLLSVNIRELFLMFIASKENIKWDKN